MNARACWPWLLLAAASSQATLSVTELGAPTLGTWLSGASGRQLLVHTDGSVSGLDAADYVSGALAGELEIDHVDGPAAIAIVAENVSASGGVTVNRILCSYDGAAEQPCQGGGVLGISGRNKLLQLGLDLTTATAHAGGSSASVSMELAVTLL